MLKHWNLETFSHKMHISACHSTVDILYTAFRYICGSLEHLLIERFE